MATLQTQLEGTVKLKDKQCEMNGKEHSCLSKQERKKRKKKEYDWPVKLIALLRKKKVFVEFKILSGILYRW